MCLFRHVLLCLIMSMCLSIVHIALHLASSEAVAIVMDRSRSPSHRRSTSRSPTPPAWRAGAKAIFEDWNLDRSHEANVNIGYLASGCVDMISHAIAMQRRIDRLRLWLRSQDAPMCL